MPKAQAGVASAVATSSRQLGNVLGVAIIGSAVTSQLHHQLATGIPGIAPAAQASIERAGAGTTSLHVPSTLPGATHASQILRDAFATASHTGWDLAASGLAIAALAYLTTSTRARAIANATMNQPEPAAHSRSTSTQLPNTPADPAASRPERLSGDGITEP